MTTFRTAAASGTPLKLDAASSKQLEAAQAIDRQKAAARAQVEKDWGIKRPLAPNESASLQILETKMAESNLNAQHVQKQGGERAVEAKERAQSLFSANIHRGTK